MCFSASASFGASVILTTVGVAAMRKVQTRSHLPFAAIPLLFGVQQFVEGLLWIALANPEFDYLLRGSTYLFLFFAQVVWPCWVPFSVLLLEKNRMQIRILILLLAIGLLVSIYLGYCITFYPVHAEISNYHIRYLFDYPFSIGIASGIIYFVPTVLPPLFSSVKRMSLLGFVILISYVITLTYFHEYVISVWCFFAAVLSAIVYSIMTLLKHQFTAHAKDQIFYKVS